ncbi:Inactive purple acid phosphatase 16 [Madurella fahalii]|uniref:Inactive purple acid phosphatase 16 n=1 Tax=Madurella fahalii TaxID=1157608 RepID=A0ABQ0GKA8_9PEZI
MSQDDFGPLRFNSDGTFQICIFEDLHFGENAWDAWGPQQDADSVEVIERILDTEPGTGLVVLNGDLITGENAFLENGTHYVDQIVGPMVQRGLTWASAYGNHDRDYNISASDLLARERQWPNTRTQPMVADPDTGMTNYYLPVYAANCDPEVECSPELLLWFFDSRGGFHFQRKDPETGKRVGQPNWVDTRVVDWFTRTSSSLVSAAGRVIPSLAFAHIPTKASLALQKIGVDPHRQPGINDDRPVSQQGQGWCANGTNHEGCSYGEQDVPFMQAITTTPGLMALFSGHDHGDTWCYQWNGVLPGMTISGNGVNLCFGQHSGYGGYGNWIRGARQVVVTLEKLADLAIDTYIRLESGATVGAVTLNETYGRDLYPETPNDKTNCPSC